MQVWKAEDYQYLVDQLRDHLPHHTYLYRQVERLTPHSHASIHVHVYAHTCMYMHVHVYAHTCMYIHVHVYAHTCMYIHVHVYDHTCMYIHVHVYAHTCMYIHVHVYDHTCMYIHALTHVQHCTENAYTDTQTRVHTQTNAHSNLMSTHLCVFRDYFQVR